MWYAGAAELRRGPGHVARDDSVKELVDRLEIPFNAWGVDPFGVSKRHLVIGFRILAALYRHYFRVQCYGIEHVPRRGRVMLVGNHSGGIALDGAMILASTLLEMDPPRLAQGMVEKFMARLPISAPWSAKIGQVVGLPEHAQRLLEADRMLMVFPEGARGTAKLYKERYSLVDFGTGFMRLALQTRTPIVPVAAVGTSDAIPTVFNLEGPIAHLLQVPYLPVTPWGLPLPLPAKITLHYGEPMYFEGNGREEDDVVHRYVDEVKKRIAALIDEGRALRGGRR
ncbi:MAG: acyltransferase family protein [Myxococcaceae bacterium]|nr:acyltransferase family protein [Myxococcaceae bacterium]